MPATETITNLEESAPRDPLNSTPQDGGARAARNRNFSGASWFVLAGLTVLLSAVTTQGADLLWGVAMGDRIRGGLGIPHSVPFAAAPSGDWANPMALGEVVLSVVHRLGPSALAVLHLTLVAATLGMLVACRVGTHHREARASLALTLTVIGGAETLAIARMPSLSLLPYAALVVLLLRNADRPSRWLWLVVPVLTLWGNLHGGVLVGCALLAVHLVCCEGPLRRRVLIGVSALAAVLLATSAGWHTIDYYRGVLSNEAARQHTGMWARPSLHQPLDVLMVLAAIALVFMWTRSRPRRWEIVAIVGMAFATLAASRNGIWLTLLLLPLAARGRADTKETERFLWRPAAAALALLVLGVGWQLTSRGSELDARGANAVSTVRALAAGRAVLAINPLDETFAQAGIRVWAGNPIDAFPRKVQREFLTFMDHGAIPPSPSIGLVVVDHHLAGAVRAAGWKQVAAVSDLLVFQRAAPSVQTSGVHP